MNIKIFTKLQSKVNIKTSILPKELKLRKLRSRATGLRFNVWKREDEAGDRDFVLACSDEVAVDRRWRRWPTRSSRTSLVWAGLASHWSCQAWAGCALVTPGLGWLVYARPIGAALGRRKVTNDSVWLVMGSWRVRLASGGLSKGREKREKRGERERERKRGDKDRDRIFDFFEFQVFETRIYSFINFSKKNSF